jgi:CHRD domain
VTRLLSMLTVGVAASLAIVALAPAAARDTYKFQVKLTSRAEVPRPKRAVSAKGTFTASYKENATGAVLTWQLSFRRLTGPAAAAHIHKGKRGVEGPVIVPLCGPCKSGQKGTVKISKGVIATLESGNAYVNVHTAKNPGGEIRGQIKVPGA